MISPLGIVTLGMLGGSGSVIYLQGGTEVEMAIETIAVDIALEEEDVGIELAQIDVKMTEEAVELGIETDEIAIET